MSTVPTIDDVRTAADRIAGVARRTPVMTSSRLDELVGARVHLKCEHLQRTGSFKFRGAFNAVTQLGDRAANGVAAHSSGNHAAALALAARIYGVTCHVVMPSNTPRVKLDAVQSYGAHVVVCPPTLESREVTLREVLWRTGAIEVHPYDDAAVIAGQGTAMFELLDEVPQMGAVVAPISGGGLISGTAIAAHGIAQHVSVIGAEPVGADDAARSLAAGVLIQHGNGWSVADGLLATLSDQTFEIVRAHVDSIVTVSEEEIVDAMFLLLSRTKQVIEPSGATALAGLMKLAVSAAPPADDIGVILSGGNVDLDRLPFGTTRPCTDPEAR